MAQLVLSAKNFVSLMRDLYGFKKLKMNRLLDKTLKENANLVINLDQKKSDQIASLVHTHADMYDCSPFDDKYVGAVAHNLPAIQFTLREWKRLVMALNGPTSNLNVDGAAGDAIVQLELTPWKEELKPMFLSFLAQGSKQHA